MIQQYPNPTCVDNGSSPITSGIKVLDIWKENSSGPKFKRELTTETLKNLPVLPMHGDIIEITFGGEKFYGITSIKGGKTTLIMDGEIARIDDIKTLSNVYKCFQQFHDTPETFIDFTNRFKQNHESVLAENNSTIEDYEDFVGFTHTGENKDFFQNPNIGWKLHVSVEPDNIKEVGEFLKEKGYYFKFLEGGDGNEKTFTIYTGSFKKSKIVGKELLKISKLLRTPKGPGVEREISFGVGVVGRFCVATDYDSLKFQRYGIIGMDMIHPENRSENYLLKLNKGEIEISNIELQQQAEVSFKILGSLFGAYFHG